MKTQLSKPARSKARYSEEYKQEALELWRASGRSAAMEAEWWWWQSGVIRLRERIREEFACSRQTYGTPRLPHALGCPGRRNRIARLMRLERIFARQRSKYRAATTDSRHGGPIAPNRLHNLAVRRSNQVWVSDATGVLTAQGWLYLVAVLDVFSRAASSAGP